MRRLGSRLERAETTDDLDALPGVQEAATAHIGRLAHAIYAERANSNFFQNGARVCDAAMIQRVGGSSANVFVGK